MVIPERTRQVHRLVLPFFILKLGFVIASLALVFLVVVGMDYVHILGRMAENKRLKGENFKLRQELQLVKNKVDSMENTVERVRNYAKKLQLLTGQGDKAAGLPQGGPIEEEVERAPAGGMRGKRRSSLSNEFEVPAGDPVLPPTGSLDEKVDKLQLVSVQAERDLTYLESYLMAQSAVMSATPSLLPIAGWVSSAFGYRRHPYDGTLRLHAGVDIAAEPGTPIRAPAIGTVIYSGYREGYGKAIVIDHGYGIRTLFAHNSRLFVQSSHKVRRGEIIAEVGSTGHSTGPHLHYEIRKNGVPVNPVTFFTRARF